MGLRYVWNDKIGNFPIEIVNWGIEDNPNKQLEDLPSWNYYVYFTEKNTPPELWEILCTQRVSYNDSFLTDIVWHGGITYGELQFTGSTFRDVVMYKAGCDYMHYWDKGITYTLENVIKDCEETVRSIQEFFAFSDTSSSSKELPVPLQIQ